MEPSGHRNGPRGSVTASSGRGDFLPAFRFRALAPYYDFTLGLTMPERRFREALLDAAALPPGARALDAGCGTGDLLCRLKRRFPDVSAEGADADPVILELARAKARKHGLEIAFRVADLRAAPYPDAAFDAVFCTLVFHLLAPEDKPAALRELWRVLKPGGAAYVSDFGRSPGRFFNPANWALRGFYSLRTTGEMFAGKFPELAAASPFGSAEETGAYRTLYGRLALWRLKKREEKTAIKRSG